MGGFFGVASKNDCVFDLFFGTDYHSHLGTKRGGMAVYDGANGFQKFFRITLPLLSPTTLFLLVTTFLSSMKVFQSVDILTSGGPARSTEVFVYLIYRYAMVDFRMDRASTAAVMFFLILLTITVLTMKISDRSVTYDS